jgi:hypothetical protein
MRLKILPFLFLVVLGFLFAVNPRNWMLAASVTAAGVVFVQILIKLLKIRRLSDVWVLALLGIGGMLLMFLAARAGFIVRDTIFRSKITEYRTAVMLAENTAPKPFGAISLPAQYSHLAQAVFAEKADDGAITVVFVLGGVFPVKHFGYVYRSTDKIEDWPGARLWAPKFRRIAPNWFGF